MNDPATMEMADAIIHDLYDGILDDRAWDRAILGIADDVGGAAAFLFALNPISGEVLRDENHRGDPAVLDAYRRHWSYHDPRLVPASTRPIGQPMTERTLLPYGEFRRTAFFNEFLLPANVPHFMPVILRRSADRFVVLSVQGTHERGPFTRQNVTDLRRLVPHLTRAVTIKDKLQAAQFGANLPGGWLNHRLPFGVLLLDTDLRVLEVNDFAARLLKDDQGISVDQCMMLMLPEPADREMRALTRTAASKGSSRDGILKIPRGLGQRALSLLVAPIPTETATWILPTQRWLVVVFDPDRRIQVDAEILRIDLGITRREAEVASLLAMDFDLATAAEKCGISVHTARNQLKSIFAKTELRSQAELVKTIISGPAAFTKHDP